MDAQGDSRLRWMCRRGTRELELVLRGYVESVLQGEAGDEDRRRLFELLSLDDTLLVASLKGEWQSQDAMLDASLGRLREHADNGDPRFRAPPW
jgi:succinate dehydrogenase flavin-adding protein (antitoxin of CptAB toxin-antitoxin module)